MREMASKLVAWAFSKFITILRLKPGDVIFVYDRGVLERLSEIRYPIKFAVPLIDAECWEGKEALLIKQMPFTTFTAIYNMAYQAHQEAEWQKAKELATNSMSTKSMLGVLGEEVAANVSVKRYGPTWPPQGSNDGQEEKPLLSHSQE